MKKKEFTKSVSIFILAVLIIAVYKTFDSLGIVFEHIGSFFRLCVPIFGALVIAFILHPICKKLEDFLRKCKKDFLTKHCRGIAITSVYLATLAVMSGFFAVILPMIFKSVTELIQQLPSIAEKFIKSLYSINYGGFSLKTFIDKITIFDVISAFNLDNVQSFMQSIAGFSKGILNVVLAIIISIYILSDRAGLLGTVDKVATLTIPPKTKPVLSKYTNRTFTIMYRYIYCQLLDALIVTVMSFIVLSVLGVKYAPILALFIGVFNLIPYFGATIACTLSALLTVFTASLSKGILVAVILIVLQQIDANIIQPRIVRDNLKVKPFWVLCSVLIGGGILGMVGVLLAVPIAALIKTMFEDYYDYRMGKSGEEAPAKDSASATSE